MEASILKKKKTLKKICQDNGITYLGLFGSYARGEQTKDSDIDLLYKFRKGKRIGLFGLADIQISFEKALDKKVDLVDNDYIKEEIKPYIEKNLITIYGKRS